MNEYEIFLGDKVVGTAYAETVGLYTHFTCHCHFSTNRLFRVIAYYGKTEINLGVCIPDGDAYTVKARVATKRLNSTLPNFQVNMQVQDSAVFIPLDAEEIYNYFEGIMEAKFGVRDGVKGIILNS